MSISERCRVIMNSATPTSLKVAEHRKNGGNPFFCIVFKESMKFLDNEGLCSMHSDCTGGKILCGACKRKTVAIMKSFSKAGKIVEKPAETQGKVRRVDNALHLPLGVIPTIQIDELTAGLGISCAGFIFTAYKLDGGFELCDGTMIERFPGSIQAFGNSYKLDKIREHKDGNDEIFVNVNYVGV